nr:structural protein 7 [Bovine rotavirus A]
MYGMEKNTTLTLLILLVLLNYILKSITRVMDYILQSLLHFHASVTPFVKSQNYGINITITGSMDTKYQNVSNPEPFLTSTLGLYNPVEAETEIADSSWKDTLSQLSLTKGWPTGYVYLKSYTDIATFSINPQIYCEYNTVLMKYNANSELDMSESADFKPNQWLCNPMDITLYNYQQTDEANKRIYMGDSGTIKVNTSKTQTLGIECQTTDTTTFEEVATHEKLAITDVVDGVNYKIKVTTKTCTMRNCKKWGPRENVALIQVGGSNISDITANPTTAPQTERMMRINGKKGRQVFYTVVDNVNQIIQAMSKRSRALQTAAIYYRI